MSADTEIPIPNYDDIDHLGEENASISEERNSVEGEWTIGFTASESTPLLHNVDDDDPPPDYTAPDAFAELPTYEQVQEECENDEDGMDFCSLFFFFLLIIIITLVNINNG